MSATSGIVGEFLSLKAATDADVLAMQCGDFYEFFADDAELVARELDLRLSEKSSNGESYPMAGVPVDDLTPYLRALVERGYRVAVADQYETDDGHAREIVRVATPGTLVETTDDAALIVAIEQIDERTFGLAAADVTTGRCFAGRLSGEDAIDRLESEVYRFDPAELLPGPGISGSDLLSRIEDRLDTMRTTVDANYFARGAAKATVREHFGQTAEQSLGLDTGDVAAIRPVGALLSYIEETGVGVLSAFTRLTPLSHTDHVRLDVATQRNLEVTEPLLSDGVDLLSTIDETTTAAGRRQLRQWITRPIQDRDVLESRQASIAAFADSALTRDALRDRFRSSADLERLTSSLSRRSADARTLRTIATTLSLLPEIYDAIAADPILRDSPVADEMDALPLADIGTITEQITAALRSELPDTIREGHLFKRGYDDSLDELIDAHKSALEWIESLAEREQAAHGITHLQVDRNRTDGYYIQVGNSETDSVPEAYQEIKTLKNSKRYTTDELTEYERKIVRLEGERYEREYELFLSLRDTIAAHTECIQQAGRVLARLDAFAGLATHAVAHGWVQPALLPAGDPIEIENGRHPVVETTTEFVPNDTTLRDSEQIALVTGPNMSGKSTYLRQTALLVLLAQIGSFIPADDARIGLVDGIFTRVGAFDELSRGRSTFMVEMQELSHILHAASDRSLVILDEVGRGTATYDGMSIAWAATEYLHNEIGAKTLFATHYHELTSLVDHLPKARCVHVATEERDGKIVFLRTIADGPADRSYGIYVAELAGVPRPVRDRADAVLADLRADRAIEARGGESVQAVFDLTTGQASTDGGEEASIDPQTQAVIDELSALNIDETAPLEALERVAEWQAQLDAE